jgi:hypothetical protein
MKPKLISLGIGLIMLVIMIIFIAYSFMHPEGYVPPYFLLIYLVYIIIMIVMFCLYFRKK